MERSVARDNKADVISAVVLLISSRNKIGVSLLFSRAYLIALLIVWCGKNFCSDTKNLLKYKLMAIFTMFHLTIETSLFTESYFAKKLL